jgi:hypothetical protein
MARPLRTDSKNRRWNAGHIRSLLLYPFFPNEGFGPDLDSKRSCWQEFKDIILPLWVKHRPGTRPLAFWEFDAPERRKRTNGQHPFDNPERKKAQVKITGGDLFKLSYGRPSSLLPGADFDDFTAEYETQFSYLERLDLLLPGEEAAVEKGEILDDVKHPGPDCLRAILEACGPEFVE